MAIYKDGFRDGKLDGELKVLKRWLDWFKCYIVYYSRSTEIAEMIPKLEKEIAALEAEDEQKRD